MLSTSRLDINVFIKRSIKSHGYKYDYSRSIYVNSLTKIIITCPEHGEFFQLPRHHMNGSGCSKCAGVFTGTLYSFIEKSEKINGNKYDYSKVNYINNKTKVEIVCKNHGSFWQRPESHTRGIQCQKCINNNILVDFIPEAIKVHGYKYDYSMVKYFSNKQKVKIICKEHGPFWQVPQSHLIGFNGCRSCKTLYGKLENEWIDSFINENIEKQIRIYKYIVDGFDKTTNTIYEFNGDFFHGNPKIYNRSDINVVTKTKFGELYDNTVYKENKLIEMGYNVISIWESDYKSISSS